ncbi:Auxin-responsive protein SAUR64 [Vitis vinifera]|uniref:Auxin-responsive protein SAUR64 n=1 Tax=Vitis vinifera TaxID=29760 RepID=A0A438EL01_VITVI|nr:Auxin-responsive protein SAUR64 [Vitis vinifera]
MISAKKLIKMARNWQKMAAIRRKRIIFPRTIGEVDADGCSTSTAEKGHFVVYSSDESRFVVPLPYLNSNIFRELFKMSEEEFGLPSNGPITLPCDAVFIEYIISLVQQSIAKDLEKALLTAIATGFLRPILASWVDLNKGLLLLPLASSTISGNRHCIMLKAEAEIDENLACRHRSGRSSDGLGGQPV